MTAWLIGAPVITIVFTVLLARCEFPSDGPRSSLITSYLAGAGTTGGVILAPPAVLALTSYVVAPSLRHLFERLLLYPLFGAASLVFCFLAVTTWTDEAAISNTKGTQHRAWRQVTHDKSVNAAYIYFTDPQVSVRSAHPCPCDPIDVEDLINLDFDEQGRLIGNEVIAATSKLPE